MNNTQFREHLLSSVKDARLERYLQGTGLKSERTEQSKRLSDRGVDNREIRTETGCVEVNQMT